MRNHRLIAAIQVCLALLFAAPAAQASRARILVLGTENPFGVATRGTLYYDDNQNLFYNPSYVNDFHNWLAFEKTNGASGFGEGGVFATLGTFSFGAYLNRGDAITTGPGNNTVANAYTNGNSFRPVDLVAGMDIGIKLGLGATFGGFTQNGVDSKDLTLRAGTQIGAFEPFASLKPLGDGRSGGDEFKDTAYSLGLRYRLGEFVPFGMFSHFAYAVAGNSYSTNTYGFGIGRNTLLADQVRFNAGLSFWRDSLSGHNVLPIDLSLEAALLQWLTVRGGLGFRLLDQVAGNSQPDSTSGRLGAALNYSKASFEWAIGHLSNGESPDGRAFDLANGFFTAASLSYQW